MNIDEFILNSYIIWMNFPDARCMVITCYKRNTTVAVDIWGS